jgi:hypothetical protein
MPSKIHSDENQSNLSSVNTDNKSKSNAKVPGFVDNRPEAKEQKAMQTNLRIEHEKNKEYSKNALKIHMPPTSSQNADESETNSSEIRQFLNGLDPNQFKGEKYEEREMEVQTLLLSENFTENQIILPEVQSKIAILAKGGTSKTIKLGEGLRMQFFDGAAAFKAYLLSLHKTTGAIKHGDDVAELLELLAPLKGLARMEVKEQEKYEGVVAKIKDVSRTSLMFESIEQIKAADAKLRAMDQHKIIETKDRFGILDQEIFNQGDGSRQTKKGSKEMETNNLNYRDIIYIVQVKNILADQEVKMEIQFHAKKMHDAKSDKTIAKTYLSESAEMIKDHGTVINEYYKKIGLTATNIDTYKENGFTGHDLYKIIRCFDLKEFKDNESATGAKEAAKELSRKIYGSVDVPE